ncbi:MAG: hypothetical protein A2660_00825 [Candidatus Doudnabacteria bacterium RIFCSPHIGHO2_01_FULL_45_18]|uniref:Type II secretion system protein GspG C-terminal domain-containing protein n=1 Tax=Candidatus Doudnabacteria bacterium RIFCSPHIGHO2_01_FULL_45_18 TaxID=1817823 RepID=A0A1F5NSM4_9BACT|nr:MAG: hypothetical protein A2660_00825 [Candidatus Doudnabacteria bacterium RIFCSPHIGHO2_01_FULL_45_18]
MQSRGFIRYQSGAGFTLIELLIVVAIIGLLLSLVVLSLGAARMKARDSKRLTDVQSIRSALDIYYDFGNGYPDTPTWDLAQLTNSQLSCLGDSAIKVPQDPLFNTGDPLFAYIYTQGGNVSIGCGGAVYSNYKFQFQTEGDTDYGPPGTYYMSAFSGITSTLPF